MSKSSLKLDVITEGLPVRNLGGENEVAIVTDIKPNGDCVFVSDEYSRKSNIDQINRNLQNIDYTKTYALAYDKWVGAKISKISGKPFKSGLKIDTVKEFGANPATGNPAFIMESCGSCVECRVCFFVSP